MITGGCLCKAVRFEIDAEPIAARTCWCRDCQYFAAGSGTVNVIFPTDKVHLHGEIHYFRSIADSGSIMHRGFCQVCGTPLTSASESRPHLTIIRAGALDDPELLGPQATIWTRSAPEWAAIDPALPQHDAQPPPVA